MSMAIDKYVYVTMLCIPGSLHRVAKIRGSALTKSIIIPSNPKDGHCTR